MLCFFSKTMEKPATQTRYKTWLSPIESREEASNIVRECTVVLLFLAALQALFAFKYGYSLLIGATAFALGGAALRLWPNKITAIVILAIALANAAVTLANNAGIDIGGGKNVAMALIVAWTGLKAVEAVFKLRGRFAVKP